MNDRRSVRVWLGPWHVEEIASHLEDQGYDVFAGTEHAFIRVPVGHPEPFAMARDALEDLGVKVSHNHLSMAAWLDNWSDDQ